MRNVVFATNNGHKLKEVQQIVGDSINLKSLADIGFADDIPEDYETLEENASQKAWHIYNQYSIDCFADDTGLEVEALGGRPGVFSARYAGEQRNSHDNIVKLLADLEGVPNRQAQFRTVIALIINGKEHRFEGVVKGAIIDILKGDDGFGYDPIFMPIGYAQTFAQMDIALKNSISHRGLAVNELAKFLRKL